MRLPVLALVALAGCAAQPAAPITARFDGRDLDSTRDALIERCVMGGNQVTRSDRNQVTCVRGASPGQTFLMAATAARGVVVFTMLPGDGGTRVVAQVFQDVEYAFGGQFDRQPHPNPQAAGLIRQFLVAAGGRVTG